MVKRIVILGTLISLSLPLEAAGPFSGRGIFRAFSSRTSTPPAASTGTNGSAYRHILHSPEKLTQIFGPSILVREQAQKPTRVSRFVTQPTD